MQDSSRWSHGISADVGTRIVLFGRAAYWQVGALVLKAQSPPPLCTDYGIGQVTVLHLAQPSTQLFPTVASHMPIRSLQQSLSCDLHPALIWGWGGVQFQ